MFRKVDPIKILDDREEGKTKYLNEDSYGFPEPENKEYIKQKKLRLNRLKESRKKWQEFLIKNGGKNKPIIKSKELKTLIRNYGVPPQFRPKIWFECCGATQKLLENQGYYQKLLQVHQEHQSQAQYQIDLDLLRTFPEHPGFVKDSPSLDSMRRILIAYSWRNPLVAYCQSLNYIVGILLLHFNEEEAFWMLVIILEEILPANFYSPDLVGVRVEGKILDIVLKDKIPKVYQSITKLQIDSSVFASGWYLRLFVGVLPLETTMRIWDVMFNEGSKILLRSSLSFLKMNEKAITQIKDFGMLIHFMGENIKIVFDEDAFIKGCFSFLKITWELIHQYRKDCDTVIRDEIRKMEEKRKTMREKTEEKKKLEELKKKDSEIKIEFMTPQPVVLETPTPEKPIEKEEEKTELFSPRPEGTPRQRRGTL